MFQRFFQWRFLLLLIATGIVGGTIYYTRYLANKIEREERQRVEEWVQATKMIQQSVDDDLTLASMISANNKNIPLIATDEAGNIIETNNLDTSVTSNSFQLEKKLKEFKQQHPPIKWQVTDSPRLVYNVYYGNTKLLSEVQYYPLVQLVVVAFFVILIISLINTQNQSTQNQVWAGMAKETAHQMGTPLTSLQGWVELLKENPDNNEIVDDLEKDVNRLKLVSDRFGKIGSTPHLETTSLNPLIIEMVTYIKRRASGKVQFEVNLPTEDVFANISPTLFNWVLENLLKNALDAMDGTGVIKVQMDRQPSVVVIDVADTGKGIAVANINKVFKPGFTTKKRGWGLGLSLSKRIMTQYHKGELTVKQSELGKGTTFRISIPAS
jgi:K+-sensing histidine kinase KdpD